MRFRINEPDLLCIDWDERSLRILNAGFGRSGPFVRSAVLAEIPSGVDSRDVPAMGAFLKRTLAEHRIRTRRAVVDVPRQDAVLSMITLPRGTTDEMAAMVHMQVGREMPFARDQAVIDFAVARPEETSPNAEIWAAAVRGSLIDHLEQVAHAAGLKVDRIGLRSYANLVALKAAGELPTRTVMVDVGSSMTEINVIRDGRLVFTRAASVSIPPTGLTAPPAVAEEKPAAAGLIGFADEPAPRNRVMDSLLVEVSRTIEAYRASDPGARVDQIVLAGTGGIDASVVEAFENRFGVTTQIFAPPESLGWDKAGGVSPAPFSATVGLALSGGGDNIAHFNFLHPKEPEGEHRERVKQVPMVAVAIGLFVAAGIVAAYVPIRTKNKKIDQLNAQISRMDSDKKQREEIQKQLQDVRGWEDRSVVWLDTLQQIATSVLPSNREAYLTRMDFPENGQVKLEIAAIDEFVAGDMAEKASQLVDGKNNPLYAGKTGNVSDRRIDPTEAQLPGPKYEFKDEVYLTVRSLQPKPATRK